MSGLTVHPLTGSGRTVNPSICPVLSWQHPSKSNHGTQNSLNAGRGLQPRPKRLLFTVIQKVYIRHV